jgi:hypothetical protein
LVATLCIGRPLIQRWTSAPIISAAIFTVVVEAPAMCGVRVTFGC